MKILETPLHNIAWPECCCRCGSSDFSHRQHSEDVVLWTTLSITRYTKISLTIPVCSKCANRQYYWFIGALLIPAAIFLPDSGSFAKQLDQLAYGGLILGLLMFTAIGLVLAGLKSKPINILEFNSEQDLVKLRIYHDQVAEAMLRTPGAKLSSYQIVRRGYLIALALVLFVPVCIILGARVFGG